MLKLIGLSKSFGGVHAVNNCSLEVKEGKITALIGPNGSGKSTLFNLVSGVLEADSGEIEFNNKVITKLAIEKRALLGISRVFQQPRVFSNLTLEENLLLAIGQDDTKFWKSFFGLNSDTKEQLGQVNKALVSVGLDELKKKQATDLSFGQKRLVELSRAMLTKHKLLMLDEPVGGVTPPMRKKIAQILGHIRDSGSTIFLIEHDMNFVLGIADEVFVLDEGKIIAHGTPAQIRKNKKVLEAYLGE
ncbi:MAG: ABC transporter ATP-binding protein [Candidatus Diapherotrites archaeon]|nr:ABC transporter ATP-binding protein [Candidatus Diapherotrites archaeon]